jgi:DNA-binding MarR family transcriptional regulator
MAARKEIGADIKSLLTRHRLLSQLSGKDQHRLAKKMHLVSLDAVEPLYQSSEAIREVFFPLSAVLFFAGTTSEGYVVEVGQIGSEGIAGVEVAMRTRFAGLSLMTASIEIPGSALRMMADDFAEEVDRYSTVNRCVRRYIGFFLAQLQLLIACNRHHSVEQRGARWLLALQDRTDSRHLYLTQQHLADMLGVTRQTADKLLDEFEAEEILESRRGIVAITDRRKLQARACECYRTIAERLEDVFAG